MSTALEPFPLEKYSVIRRPRIRVIGLHGLPGSGKNTVAALLHMVGFRSISLADALRDEVERAIANRDVPDHMPDHMRTPIIMGAVAVGSVRAKPTTRLMREILQWWGTEYRRTQDEGYWLRLARHEILSALSRGENVALTDIRYPNEEALVRDLGGIMWRVDRPGLVPTKHASDNQQIKYDDVIWNHGLIDDLAVVVKQAWRKLDL